MSFKRLRAIPALILIGATAPSCAAIQASRRRNAEAIIEAVNHGIRYRVRYRDRIGGFHQTEALIKGLEEKDIWQLYHSGFKKTALSLYTAAQAGRLDKVYIRRVAYPSPEGVWISWLVIDPVGKKISKNHYLVAAPVYERDPDAALSGRELQDKYGVFNYSSLQPHQGLKPIWVFNPLRQKIAATALVVRRFLVGQDSGLEVIEIARSSIVKLSPSLAGAKIKLFSRHYWLFFQAADELGNNDGACTPWEWANYWPQVFKSVALLEGKVPERWREFLARQGLTQARASEIVEKLTDLIKSVQTRTSTQTHTQPPLPKVEWINRPRRY